MSSLTNNKRLVLTGNLVLDELSNKNFPEIDNFEDTKIIDLQQLKNIDSAGLAYLAQIKSQHAGSCFSGVSDNILVLAKLYGLSFLFDSLDS